MLAALRVLLLRLGFRARSDRGRDCGPSLTNRTGPLHAGAAGQARVTSLRVPGVADLVVQQQRRAMERQRTRFKSAPGSTPGTAGATTDSEPTTPVLGPISEEAGRPEDRELLPRCPPAPGDSRHPLQAEMERPQPQRQPPPLQRADAADHGTTPARCQDGTDGTDGNRRPGEYRVRGERPALNTAEAEIRVE